VKEQERGREKIEGENKEAEEENKWKRK